MEVEEEWWVEEDSDGGSFKHSMIPKVCFISLRVFYIRILVRY